MIIAFHKVVGVVESLVFEVCIDKFFQEFSCAHGPILLGGLRDGSWILTAAALSRLEQREFSS